MRRDVTAVLSRSITNYGGVVDGWSQPQFNSWFFFTNNVSNPSLTKSTVCRIDCRIVVVRWGIMREVTGGSPIDCGWLVGLCQWLFQVFPERTRHSVERPVGRQTVKPLDRWWQIEWKVYHQNWTIFWYRRSLVFVGRKIDIYLFLFRCVCVSLSLSLLIKSVFGCLESFVRGKLQDEAF